MPLATKKQVFEVLWNNGFFSGYDVILSKFNPDVGEAGGFKRDLYAMLLKEVLEAKRETVRLQRVIDRMESKCRHGMISAGNPRMGWDAHATSLQGDVEAFDGWAVSLFESNITLLHYIHSIETAANRSATIYTSMKGVIEKRRSEFKLFESDPSLFKLKLL